MPELSAAPRTPFYQFARLLCVALSALVYPCKLLNPEGIKRDAPFLLVCNHQSMMDPLLLAAKFRHHEIRFIGKRELTRFKPLKWVVEKLHMIAVSRHMTDLGALRAASAVLKEGHVLGIFPEGTRMRGKPMEHIESGVSLLALRRHREARVEGGQLLHGRRVRAVRSPAGTAARPPWRTPRGRGTSGCPRGSCTDGSHGYPAGSCHRS